MADEESCVRVREVPIFYLYVSEAINPKKKRRKEGERNSWNNLANGSSLLDGKDVSEWLLHIV